ncbi:cupin domain-containing protein [Haloarchaeobius litoreus]|uniref:Cupin domain-containing protein n=1 Tax=Haloarchaeobius litoreus TaxID=755306 RepID=A0ABD6DHW1_9EURY|nr:cupin domain-containing protein [Haloarchaeobius litoreus]
MERVDIDDVEPAFMDGSDLDRRGLSKHLGTEDLAINYYAIEPGEALSGGMHAHFDQEEVFYVVEGEVTFQTPEEEFVVGEHEVVRFAPGDFQTSVNDGDEVAVVIALGAPKPSEDIRVPMECRECGESETLQFLMTEDGQYLRCPECDNQFEAPV